MKLHWNILSTLASRIAMMCVALASSMVLARVLGPQGRGLFALILVLPEMLRSFGLFGFEQSNAVYAGLFPDGRKALVWQSLLTAFVIGCAFAVGGVVYLLRGAPGFPNLLKGPLWLYLLTFATLPFGLLSDYWGAILRGMNRIHLLNILEISIKVGMLLLLCAALFIFHAGVTGAVWANFLGYLLGVVLLLVFLLRAGILAAPTLDFPLWKKSAGFAIPAHAGTIAAYLNYRVDEILVASMLPVAQLGFYSIAVGMVERIWIVPGAVATALLPHLTNSRERDPKTAAIIARHVMLWVGAGCLLLFVAAGWIVRFLYTNEFAPAVAPLRWLLPGIFTLSIGKVLVAELLAQEKPRYTIYASTLAAIANVLANVLLIPRMGISGASLASSISYTLLSAVLIWYYLRETGVGWTELIPRPQDIRVYFAALRSFRGNTAVQSRPRESRS
jgi:O-antigen/teichoic acid export membrane protein